MRRINMRVTNLGKLTGKVKHHCQNALARDKIQALNDTLIECVADQPYPEYGGSVGIILQQRQEAFCLVSLRG